MSYQFMIGIVIVLVIIALLIFVFMICHSTKRIGHL